jgi:UTP--glucose-1-phosphate uridylyltransferase
MDSTDTALEHLSAFRRKMEAAGLQPLVLDTFANYYRQVCSGARGFIPDNDILPVMPEDIDHYRDLATYRDTGRKAARKAVHITLNGGLGTSMGLTGAKSLLPVHKGRSFLEIILKQTAASGARLCLMNSFNTEAETQAALQGINPDPHPLSFRQHQFPKILQDTLAPADWPANRDLEWNPPGHGDVYSALFTSGMLQRLLDDGIRYAFIANCDNLGASLDPVLLGYFVSQGFPFLMEVAPKTRADVKGGHLARKKEGGLLLREVAQCPEDELEVFKDIARYRYFNTNNIWVDLQHLVERLQRLGIVDLPMIVNPKTLDPRDSQSPLVYQVESAMGAAIALFDEAAAVEVPRSRFFPVKKCSDLLALRSDLFTIDQNGGVLWHSNQPLVAAAGKLTIELDPRFYAKIDQFEARFAEGIPSLVDCESLVVKGDVRFGRDVHLKGRVVIVNPKDEQTAIAAGSIIEGNYDAD